MLLSLSTMVPLVGSDVGVVVAHVAYHARLVLGRVLFSSTWRMGVLMSVPIHTVPESQPVLHTPHTVLLADCQAKTTSHPHLLCGFSSLTESKNKKSNRI